MTNIITFFYFLILGSFEIQGQFLAVHCFELVSSFVVEKASFEVVENFLADNYCTHYYNIDN